MRFSALLLLAAALLSKSADAFPSGAGSCGPGNTSVQSTHLINPTTGSLATGGFTVSLDGAALAEGETSVFAVGKDVKVTVAGKAFKGFLVRLGKTDVSTIGAFKAEGNDVQVAAVCFDAGGITHTANANKTSVSATLNLAAAAADMPVDVTVVVVNSGGKSEYYYSQFKVTAGDAPVASTKAPTPAGGGSSPVSPSAAAPNGGSPVAVPKTPAPVAKTPAPVLPITPAPVAKTAAPVLPVTPAPVAKTPAPVLPVTPAPVAKTPAPVLPVTPAPFVAQTKSPVAPETAKPTDTSILASTASPSATKGTAAPNVSPVRSPVSSPVGATPRPTATSVLAPTIEPTKEPTKSPTKSPTNSPTKIPTKSPIVSSKIPTKAPTPPVNVANGSYVWTKPGWWLKYRRQFGTKAYGLKKCTYLENKVPVNGSSCLELATGPYFCAFGSQFACGRTGDFFDNPTTRCNCYDGKFDCFPVVPDINCADYPKVK